MVPSLEEEADATGTDVGAEVVPSLDEEAGADEQAPGANSATRTSALRSLSIFFSSRIKGSLSEGKLLPGVHLQPFEAHTHPAVRKPDTYTPSAPLGAKQIHSTRKEHPNSHSFSVALNNFGDAPSLLS